jgi:hypothetical protein
MFARRRRPSATRSIFSSMLSVAWSHASLLSKWIWSSLSL